MAYQLDLPGKTLHTKPAGGGSRWCSGNKGVFMWGRSTGLTCEGKTLIECRDVDLLKEGRDGKVDSDVKSRDVALAKITVVKSTDLAFFWDPESGRLIRKPKDRGLCWSRVTKDGTPYDGQGGIMFLWAETPLFYGQGGVGVVGGAMKQPEPVAEVEPEVWWHLSGVDLSGGDTRVQTCGSLKHAQTIMQKKTTRCVGVSVCWLCARVTHTVS